jgi:hypothetical protein
MVRGQRYGKARREARAQTHELQRWEQLPSTVPGQAVFKAQCYKCPAFALVTVRQDAPGAKRLIQVEHHGTDQYYQHPWLSGW